MSTPLKIPNFQLYKTYRLRNGQQATIVSFNARNYSYPFNRMIVVVHTPEGDVVRRYRDTGHYISPKLPDPFDIVPDTAASDVIHAERVEDVLRQVRGLLTDTFVERKKR